MLDEKKVAEAKDTLKKSCTKVKEDLASDKFPLVECSLKQQVESLCEETLQWLLNFSSNANRMTDVQKMQEEIESSVKKVEEHHQIIIEQRKRLKQKKVSFKLYCFEVRKSLQKVGKYYSFDDELKQAVDLACGKALESVDAEGVTCDAIQRMQEKIESKLERIVEIHSRKMSEKQHIVAINSFIKKCHETKLQFSEGGKYRELNGNDRMKVIKFCDEAVKEIFERNLSEKYLNSLHLQFNKTLRDANECHKKLLQEKAKLDFDKKILLGSCCNVERAFSIGLQSHLIQAMKSLTNETRVGLSKESLSRSEFEAMKSNYFVRLNDIKEQQKQYEEDRKLAKAHQDFSDFCNATKSSFSGSGLLASVGDEIRTEIVSACDEALDWMVFIELTVGVIQEKKEQMELLVKNSLEKHRSEQEKVLLAKNKVSDSLLELKEKFSVDGKHGNVSECGRKSVIDMCNEGQKLKLTATLKQLEEHLKKTEKFSQQVVQNHEKIEEKRLDACKKLQLLCLETKLDFDCGGKYANVEEGKKVIKLCDQILVEMKEENLSLVDIENKQSQVVHFVQKILEQKNNGENLSSECVFNEIPFQSGKFFSTFNKNSSFVSSPSKSSGGSHFPDDNVFHREFHPDLVGTTSPPVVMKKVADIPRNMSYDESKKSRKGKSSVENTVTDNLEIKVSLTNVDRQSVLNFKEKVKEELRKLGCAASHEIRHETTFIEKEASH